MIYGLNIVIWSVVYTDNLKGFRRRCMVKKLEILMKQIEDRIEMCYEDAIFDDVDDMSGIEEAQYQKEMIEELESNYSMVWRILIQLEKGQRTSKTDLEYVNDVHRRVLI